MEELKFPAKFVGWVMECVEILHYSIGVNGEYTESFDATRGLRQGDTMSPLLCHFYGIFRPTWIKVSLYFSGVKQCDKDLIIQQLGYITGSTRYQRISKCKNDTDAPDMEKKYTVQPTISLPDTRSPHPPIKGHILEQGEELVHYIPGIKPICVKDLPSVFYGKGRKKLPFVLDAISLSVNKAQYTLFTTIEALEPQVIEALQAKFPVPIFTVGPTIPYFDTEFKTNSHNQPSPNYMAWLNDQPKDSVLYISQGSFMSVSNQQLDEIKAGVQSSRIRTFGVARENASLLTDGGENGNRGIVLPWCNQLRVLCHPSVGAFWSHCGWNSTKEGAFAGVPFLTFPIAADQITNSKLIVEDWKIGWRVNNESENLVKRDEIALLVQRFLDLDSYQGREMRRRAMEIRKSCQEAIEGGAIQGNIDRFIRDISQSPRR
ncbi:UDP-glycosyltransferase 87A2-like [Lycium ferocissimum]|uniref:UDP-glycosyltransferase 87A2-like n=1 Tax=Lycium ferocissimum TaxID=112874 RepID=UPI0028149B3E|nr:UDP-glycosyltransferase 87A2-like [Lycium ferocissimum]